MEHTVFRRLIVGGKSRECLVNAVRRWGREKERGLLQQLALNKSNERESPRTG